MTDHIKPEGDPPDWSDGHWVFVRAPARSTPHPELQITPFMVDDRFTITHAPSGLRVLDCATIDEGLAICQALTEISFTDPGQPGSRRRAELTEEVKRALMRP